MIAYPEDFDHASSLAGMFLHFHFWGFSNKFRMRAQVACVIASSEEVKVVELMRIILLQCLFGMQKVACFRELLLFLCVREKSLGYAGATPASVVPDVLRVLARNTQVFLFPLGKEKASFRWPYLFGAQKRTRTSTPCGTRT